MGGQYHGQNVIEFVALVLYLSDHRSSRSTYPHDTVLECYLMSSLVFPPARTAKSCIHMLNGHQEVGKTTGVDERHQKLGEPCSIFAL